MSQISRFFFTSIFCFYSVFALAQNFQEGVHYKTLPDSYARQPTAAALLQQDAGKTEILEFFNYYCPGCYSIEPTFEVWRKQAGASVTVHRVPVAFQPQWEMVAKAYYTAYELGLLETIHADLFQAIQQQRKTFTTQGQLADFFAQHGVDPVKFNASYEGFNVNRYWERAKLLKKEYDIRIVPAIIVAGKYYTDLGMAKTPTEMIDILQYLIQLSNATPTTTK